MSTSIESPASKGGVAAPVARTVADDMESIFPNATARVGGASRLRLTRADRPVARSRTSASTAGALLAAALFGVSMGAFLGREVAPTPAAPEVAATPDALRLASAAPPLPNPGPLAPAVLYVARSRASPRPAPADRVERTASRPREPSRRFAAARDASPCRGDCGHDDVMAADARLRRAYASAVDAGAPRAVLVDYRSEWSSLRHRAPRQPGLVTARYSEMAADLNRIAGRERHAYAEPPRELSWQAFRSDVKALWR